jgi:hypothetical protein
MHHAPYHIPVGLFLIYVGFTLLLSKSDYFSLRAVFYLGLGAAGVCPQRHLGDVVVVVIPLSRSDVKV